MEKELRYPRTTLVLRLSCTCMGEPISAKEKEQVMDKLVWNKSYCKIQLDADYCVDMSDDKWRLQFPSRPYCGCYGFDGEAFLFQSNSDRKEDAKRLLPGQVVTSEFYFQTEVYRPNRMKKDVKVNHATLTISWPEWKKDIVSVEKLIQNIRDKEQLVKTDNWNNKPFDVSNHEVEVQVADGQEEPRLLKSYPMAQWPAAFTSDLEADPHLLDAYAFVRIQPIGVHPVTYSHTDDYMDAAEGYGEDVERETTVVERIPTGNRLEYDLK